MIKVMLILFISGIAQAAPDGPIYKCARDGRTIITNIPCNGKPAEMEKKRTPDYPEIVNCSLIGGVENLARVFTGQNRKNLDCSKMK